MRRQSFGTDSRVLPILGGLALAAAICVLPARPAMAQEIQVTGPLAGAPAVRRLRQYRANRLQLIVPSVGYTLQDQYSRSVMTGLEAVYNITDWLGIGVWGAAANFANAFQINTDLTTQVTKNGQTTDRNRLSLPSPGGFGQQVARLLGVATGEIVFAPLRGKLALFQGLFVDTDFYIFFGAGAAFVQGRANVTGTQAMAACGAAAGASGMSSGPCLATQSAHQTVPQLTLVGGVGLNLYFNSWLGLALQWRAFPFSMNPGGFDEAGGSTRRSSVPQPDHAISGADRHLYFNHMATIGLIINLPTDVAVSE